MRLAVRQAAGHRIADSGGELRVNDVEVDRDVEERPATDPLERLLDHGLNPASVEVADRVDREAELANERPLTGVERAHADEGNLGRINRRDAQAVRGELGAAQD